MFFDQKRQIQTLTTRLEQAMKERKSYEEKSCHLQQVKDSLYRLSRASCLSLLSRCKAQQFQLSMLISEHLFGVSICFGGQGLHEIFFPKF